MRVALFTRWPEPGQAKTRLIPAIGGEAAAALHKRLTERTIAVVHAAGLALEIRSTGAPIASFQEWLGQGTRIIDQGTGDLGQRLARAAQSLPVLLLGADIPDLAPHHLTAAAEALATNPAVIGPAEDGGYWLLGLATPAPQLFENMPWGTETVFETTSSRLTNPVLLPVLADLDRPEDLPRWPNL
nr:TIGR04282 family arsenosugar biosynthesis glycosyltransferase [Polymorphobacter sp.]